MVGGKLTGCTVVRGHQMLSLIETFRRKTTQVIWSWSIYKSLACQKGGLPYSQNYAPHIIYT